MRMDQICEYYAHYSEESRLFDCNQHLSEYLVTMHLLQKYLPVHGTQVLDCCAGTGAYAFALAREGARVTAGDLVSGNVAKMQAHPDARLLENTYVGSAADLSMFQKDSFDAVLCRGALYHLPANERQRCMQECLRVLKPTGMLVIAWHSIYALALGAQMHAVRQTDAALRRAAYEQLDQCVRTHCRNIFHGMTIDEVLNLPHSYPVECVAHASTYPALYNQFAEVDDYSEEEFKRYIDCLCETCEDELAVRYTMHGLSILRKK